MTWKLIQPQGPANAKRTHDGQLGYAKQEGACKEKLASILAAKLKLPVPEVDICHIDDWGTVAVSHVFGENSQPLATKDHFVREHRFDLELLNPAAREASVLLPFLVWIAAYDHLDNTNLVVDRLDATKLRLRAIDFGDAFHWAADANALRLPGPPILRENADAPAIERVLESIKGFPLNSIMECCVLAFDDPNTAEMYGGKLSDRKQRLPSADEIIEGARKYGSS